LGRLNRANLYHDAHFRVGPLDASGTPFADDVELPRKASCASTTISRHEVLLSTDAYNPGKCRPGPDFPAPHDTAENHYLLGGYILERETALGISRKSGCSRRAPVRRADLHVVPGLVHRDERGEQALTGSQLRFDPARTSTRRRRSLRRKTPRGKSGILIIGGGSPKNFVLQTETRSRKSGHQRKGADYTSR